MAVLGSVSMCVRVSEFVVCVVKRHREGRFIVY